MPVYEMNCKNCGKRFSVLMGVIAESDDETCPHCGSKKTIRLISRFARYRAEDERLDELAGKVEGMPEPKSYIEMRKTMREMGSALDDSAADEMEEFLEADLEGGEEPEE